MPVSMAPWLLQRFGGPCWQHVLARTVHQWLVSMIQHGFRSPHPEFQLNQSHYINPTCSLIAVLWWRKLLCIGRLFSFEPVEISTLAFAILSRSLLVYSRGKGQWLDDLESRANRKKRQWIEGGGCKLCLLIFLGHPIKMRLRCWSSLHEP